MVQHTQAVQKIPFSFELYPPRTPARSVALEDTIRKLAASGPDFLSVTYGAGGSTGGESLRVLKWILANTDIEPIAHLTCVGNDYATASALIREFLDAGILRFLAVRGDPPLGKSEDDSFLGDLRTSSELVQLIHRVQAERVPYSETEIPVGRRAVRIDERQHARTTVAAFPNGHPRSRHPREHIDALLAKQAAGADAAITQLFFHADDYLRFVDRAKAAGVTIPIIPGFMPVTSSAKLRRMLELTGEPLPVELSVALEVEPTLEGRKAAGVEYAANLAREVLAGGAPGIHLYAFNEHETVLSVLREAGVPTREHAHP